MPQATLAAVVVVSCAGMIRLREFRAIFQTPIYGVQLGDCLVRGAGALGHIEGHFCSRYPFVDRVDLPCEPSAGVRPWSKARH